MTTIDFRILDRIVLEAKALTPHRRAWTAEEDQFLRDNVGFLTDAEIGERLNRSENAVHLRRERNLHLPAPSKDPRYVNAQRAANMLGIDQHKIIGWIQEGLIPARIMAGGRNIRLIKRVHFMMFVFSPRNWVYFNPNNVRDAKLLRMLSKAQKRWGDQWWTTRMVADYHGVDTGDVKRYIHNGYLKSFRLPVSLGGRQFDRKWSNHFVLRSEAMRKDLVFVKKGKGNTFNRYSPFTPAADAWLLKARDELGMTFVHIGRTMKIGSEKCNPKTGTATSNPTIAYRYHELKKAQAKKAKVRK